MRSFARLVTACTASALLGLVGAGPVLAAPSTSDASTTGVLRGERSTALKAVAAATTAATTATTPVLVDPLVWRPSTTSHVFKAPADRDVLIEWPATPLDVSGGFQFTGGRNVVSRGGIVEFSKRYTTTGVAAVDNRCLKISGNYKATAPRTILLDGFHCAGDKVWEGINFDAKAERSTMTLRMHDIRIDQVNVDLGATLGSHDGGDAFQTWNGPHVLDVDGFTATNLKYQGLFLQPFAGASGTLSRWTLSNVSLSGSPSGHGYLLWLAGSRTRGAKSYVDIQVKNVVIKTAPKQGWKATWNKAQWPDVTVVQG